jgi:hypothetical protein
MSFPLNKECHDDDSPRFFKLAQPLKNRVVVAQINNKAILKGMGVFIGCYTLNFSD